MTAHPSVDWLLFYITLAVLAFFGITVKWAWDRPLHNGPDYFLGVKVRSGFYEGGGRRWLRGWHAVVLGWYSITLFAALAVFISGRWSLFPVWGGGTAVLYVASLLGFVAYARAKLGSNPPVQSSVAIPLQSRRPGDYISWRVEAFIGAIIAFSWALLLANGGVGVHWSAPVVFTYIIAGLLLLKIPIARESFPLPADRPEEHLRWMEENRRYRLQMGDLIRWFFVALLGEYALLHGWPALSKIAWLRWLLVGITGAAYLVYLGVFIIRGGKQMDAMGRGLAPPGSWSTPFRRAQSFSPRYLAWFCAWFAGLVLLLVFLH